MKSLPKGTCPTCKTSVGLVGSKSKIAKNGVPYRTGSCSQCGRFVSTFLMSHNAKVKQETRPKKTMPEREGVEPVLLYFRARDPCPRCSTALITREDEVGPHSWCWKCGYVSYHPHDQLVGTA